MTTRPTSELPPADVDAALADLGIEIAFGRDDELYALCPMHEARTGKPDRRPSWSVNRLSGLHACFSCGYRGSFHRLVMDVGGLDAWAAATWIRNRGVDLQAHVERLWITPRSPEPDRPKVDRLIRYAMFDAVPDGQLRRRSISATACEHYGIRWDPDREAWIIPIRGPEGLLGWQTKYLDGRVRNNARKRIAVFGLHEFPAGATAILVESPLDVARLWTAGFEGGLATYGTGWSNTQLRAIEEHTDSLVLAYDNDAAGHRASRSLIEAWHGRLRIEMLDYSGTDAKDIGEMDDAEIDAALANRRHWIATTSIPAVRN